MKEGDKVGMITHQHIERETCEVVRATLFVLQSGHFEDRFHALFDSPVLVPLKRF